MKEKKIVTDTNGNFDSSKNAHSNNTNKNDSLADLDVIPVASIDYTAGVWFGAGEDGSKATVNDDLRALPYGYYTLTELRTDTNEGYDLIEIEFFVGGRYSNTLVDAWAEVDLGTLTDSK